MHKIALLLILAALPAWAACPDSPTGYAYCLPLPVDNTKVSGSSNLTNYIGWIAQTDDVLRTVANGGHVQDGNDLRFQIGTTALDYQLISYTATTGALKAWVRIPSLLYDTDTQVYLYYGKTAASGEPNPSGVWSEYKTVYHLNEDTGSTSTIVDSANAHNGTAVSMTGANQIVSGPFGYSLDFDGSNDYVGSITDHANLNAAQVQTLQAWINVDNWPVSDPDAYLMTIFSDETAAPPTMTFRVGSAADVNLKQRIGINYHDGSNHDTQSSTNMTIDTWYKITVTTDGSNARFYYGATLDASPAYTITPTNKSNAWTMGNYVIAGARRWDGMLAEIRYRNGALSADWITTEYANENDPSTFFVKGTEQTVGGASPRFRVQAIIGVLFWRSAWLLDYWQ